MKKLIFIINILKEKEKTSKVEKVIKIFEKEYIYLSDNKSKLDKQKKKYLDSLIKEINKIEKDIKEKIKEDFLYVIEEVEKNIILSSTNIVDLDIKEQILYAVILITYKANTLITKSITNYEAMTIYDNLTNYYIDYLNSDNRTQNEKWENIEEEVRYNLNIDEKYIYSNIQIEKTKELLEFRIKHFQDRFEDLYVITDDNLYNKLELAIIEEPDLLKEENADKLAELINNLKEEYVKENNMTGRLHLEYKED
jgi:hypothetical protein